MALVGTVNPGNPMGFKNRIINGDFRIWQRGTSFSSVASGQYTADRWQLSYRTAGVTIARQVYSNYYAVRLTNTDGSVQSFDFEQRIEDTAQFDNTTYTLSFYAKASTAVTLGVNIYANYGTGGSSQDTVYSNSVALTTTRTKYTITLPFPDMSAKTIGAVGSGGSYVRTLFSIASLPSNAWYEVDSVQVEPGSVATSFDFRPQGIEEMLCQRFYYKFDTSVNLYGITSSYNGSNWWHNVYYPTSMRIVPTVSATYTNGSPNNVYPAKDRTSFNFSAQGYYVDSAAFSSEL